MFKIEFKIVRDLRLFYKSLPLQEPKLNRKQTVAQLKKVINKKGTPDDALKIVVKKFNKQYPKAN